jgi:predicted alpha/beta superfamily hydrolase
MWELCGVKSAASPGFARDDRSYKSCIGGVGMIMATSALFVRRRTFRSFIFASMQMALYLALGTLFQAAEVASSLSADRGIKIGERLELKSEILNERRRYWVYLPASYHDKEFAPQRYPVLYLFDGDLHFQSASGVVQFMSENINANVQIPELIIVAIPNTHRARDLTPTNSGKGYDGKDTPIFAQSGGGPLFLKFLREELIPHIERNYRTEPYRILVGHSLGGLLAAHDCLQSSPVFQAHLAIDPAAWWDDQFLLKSAKQIFQKGAVSTRSLYMALANEPPNKNFPDPLLWNRSSRALADFFGSNAHLPFRFRFQYFESETHSSVPLLSLYEGLLFTFEGFKPKFSAERSEDPALLEKQFLELSTRLGYTVKPPERYINSSAWSFLNYDRMGTNALKWLEFNMKLYPNSSNAYASLGEAHNLRGDRETAIKLLQRAVEIWPDNAEAKDLLQRLTASSKR